MVTDEEPPPEDEEWLRDEGGERTDDEWFPDDDYGEDHVENHGEAAWVAERRERLLESEESERDVRWAAAAAVVAEQVPLLPARFDAETDGELLGGSRNAWWRPGWTSTSPGSRAAPHVAVSCCSR